VVAAGVGRFLAPTVVEIPPIITRRQVKGTGSAKTLSKRQTQDDGSSSVQSTSSATILSRNKQRIDSPEEVVMVDGEDDEDEEEGEGEEAAYTNAVFSVNFRSKTVNMTYLLVPLPILH
jgi:hypothetical protein